MAGCTGPGGRGTGLPLRSAAPGAWRCYPGPSAAPFLVRYDAPGHVVTVLGTGAPLANANLGATGNAALALNLLAGSPRIVWLVPGPLPVPAAAHPGRRSLGREQYCRPCYPRVAGQDHAG